MAITGDKFIKLGIDFLAFQWSRYLFPCCHAQIFWHLCSLPLITWTNKILSLILNYLHINQVTILNILFLFFFTPKPPISCLETTESNVGIVFRNLLFSYQRFIITRYLWFIYHISDFFSRLPPQSHTVIVRTPSYTVNTLGWSRVNQSKSKLINGYRILPNRGTGRESKVKYHGARSGAKAEVLGSILTPKPFRPPKPFSVSFPWTHYQG